MVAVGENRTRPYRRVVRFVWISVKAEKEICVRFFFLNISGDHDIN